MATFDDIWDKPDEEYPGLQSNIVSGINLAKQWAAQNGVPLQVTETVRPADSRPVGGAENSLHYTGGAADLAWEGLQWGDSNFNGIADYLEQNGYSVIREPHGTGPHVHFSGGSSETKQANRTPVTFDNFFKSSVAEASPTPVQKDVSASTAPMEDAMLAQANNQQVADATNSWNGTPGFSVDKFVDNATQMAKSYWNTLTEPNPLEGATYVPASDMGPGYITKDGNFVTPDQVDKQTSEYAQRALGPAVFPLAMVPNPLQKTVAPIAGGLVVDALRQAYNSEDAKGQQQGMVGVGKTIASPVTGLYDKFVGNPDKFKEDLSNSPAETLFNTAIELGVLVAVGKGVYEMRKPKPTAEPTPEYQPSETGPVTRQYTAEDLTPASRQELLDAIKNQLEQVKQQKWDSAENHTPANPEVVDYSSWWDKNATRAEKGQVDLITREVTDGGLTPNIPIKPDAAVLDALKKKPYESMFDRAEKGQTDIITRQTRELTPEQQWWYDNAERMPERRVQPPADIADFVDYRDVVQAETNAPSSKIIQELNIRKNGLIKDMVQELKASIQGVEKVRISEHDPVMGQTTTALFNQSQNPKWYSKFWRDNKRAPTAEDYRYIAEDALNRGIDLYADRIPPSEHFKAINKTIDAIQKAEQAPDIIKPDSIANPKEAANMLANYHSDAGKLYDATSFLDRFKKAAIVPEKGSVRAGLSTAADASKSPITRGVEAGRQIYTDYVDRFSPIQNEVSRFQKETGIKLKAEESPYDRAQTAHTASSRAEMLVNGKTPEEISALKEYYPIKHDVTMSKTESALPKEVSAKMKSEGFDNVYDAFDGYLAAKRQLELQRNNPDYVGPIDSAKAAKYIAENPELAKAADLFYKYGDNLLEIAQDAGNIAPEVVAAIRSKYQNYAPMSRDFSDVSAMGDFFGQGRGMVNVNGVLKRIKEGSERAVVSPMESMIKNTYAVLSAVERNKVGKAIADLSELSDGAYFAKKTSEPASPTKSIFTVKEKGENVNYQTTPELYRALTAMNEEAAGQLIKVLSYPTGWLRAGATLDPGFFVKNVTRDAFTAGVYSKYGFVPVYDTLRGVADIIGNKELYARYKASGAPMSVITGMDRNSLSKAIQNLNGKELWANYNPIEILRDITGFFENATRIREFQKAELSGEGTVGKTRAAQEVTLNFGQSGAKGSTPNKLIAFLNAQIQGVNKLVQEHKTNPVRTATRAAAYITLPSIGLWLMNHDDVRYQELPAYQRDLFWIVPTGTKLTKERFDALIKSGKTRQQILDESGPLIRIPKPFELGLVYGSLPERFLDYAMTKDPKGMKKWAESTMAGLMPNVIPTIATPIIENITNHSFFMDRPIVPRRQEGLPAKMQASTQTSAIAKWAGEKAEAVIPGGYSPSKIDNALAGYFGGLGKTAIGTAELIAQVKNGQASKLLTEQPVLRSFFVTPLRGSESVQEFYEKYGRQSELKQEFEKTKAKPADFNPALYNKLNQANTAISALNKEMRRIESDPKMNPDDKRKRLDSLSLSVLGIARKSLSK